MEAVVFLPQGPRRCARRWPPLPGPGPAPGRSPGCPAAAFFSSWMTLALPRMVTYLGANSCSRSTPSSFLGRSLMCPLLETHLDVVAQVFLQGFRLGGRFHDKKSFCHNFKKSSSRIRDLFGSFQFYLNAPAMQGGMKIERSVIQGGGPGSSDSLPSPHTPLPTL